MCFMNKLFEKLNLGRRKAAQSERISARSHFRPISRNSIDTSGAYLYIMTGARIVELQKKGYEVEILRKMPSTRPRIATDIVIEPKRRQLHPVPTTVEASRLMSIELPGYTTPFHDVCFCSDTPPGRSGGTGRKRKASFLKPTQTIVYKSKRKELLEEYLVLVKEHARLSKRLIDYGKKLHEALPDDDTPIPDFNIFQPFVDEDKLSNCFFSIYQEFFGATPTVFLDGYYKKPIDLIAYFFILVEWEKLGSFIFSEKCKKPFFDYVCEKVIANQIGKTERTFYNRLTLTMNDFRQKLMKEPASSKFKDDCWKKDMFIKDFLKVVGIFHGMEYYKELMKHKYA